MTFTHPHQRNDWVALEMLPAGRRTSQLFPLKLRASAAAMTPKQNVYALVEALPDDSPLLRDVTDVLRLNRALDEAMDDIREGRTMGSDEFIAKVAAQWPKKSSE